MRISIANDQTALIEKICHLDYRKVDDLNANHRNFDGHSLPGQIAGQCSLKRADISMHALEVAFHIESSRLFIS